MTRINLAIALGIVSLAIVTPAHAASYTLTTTVTTDGVQSFEGGTLDIFCRAAGSSTWGSCGSTVASGTTVSIWANTAEGYWFMWYMTNPYLQGCTTMNWGWGVGPNPNTECTFIMPSQNVSINAEFQVP